MAEWLLVLLASGYVGSLGAAPGNPIPVENQMPGTDDWRIWDRCVGYSYSKDEDGEITGYSDQPSVNLGEDLAFLGAFLKPPASASV
jgi:hypothetical protein